MPFEQLQRKVLDQMMVSSGKMAAVSTNGEKLSPVAAIFDWKSRLCPGGRSCFHGRTSEFMRQNQILLAPDTIHLSKMSL